MEHRGHLHAIQGFLESGFNGECFREKHRGVLLTVDKIERKLDNTVRYNPTLLAGMACTLDERVDFITALLGGMEEIKRCCVFAVQVIPSIVRAFTTMVVDFFPATGRMPA
jgi:hypothetical protein